SYMLAQKFGLTANPIDATGGNGTNYAASGATVTGALNGSQAPNFVSQVNSYLSSFSNVADPNALYLIHVSGNGPNIATNMDPVAAAAYMVTQADNLVTSIQQLYADGARNFIIDFGGGTKNLGFVFSNEVINQMTAAGIPFVTADISTLVN